MTLLYLYVEKFGIIEKAEFNFSDKHRFHYDPKAQQISEITYNSVGLPDDIFSFTKEERVVDCVSAIVGRNASGKTSVASILADIISNPRPSTEFIIIWQTINSEGKKHLHKYPYVLENVLDESEFDSRLANIHMPNDKKKIIQYLKNCYRSSQDNRLFLDRKNSSYLDTLSFCDLTPFLKRNLFIQQDQSFFEFYKSKIFTDFPDLIYITNNYTPFGGVIPNLQGISNLSTSCLIKTDSETYKNASSDEFESLKQGDSVMHDQLELLRMVRLFHDMASEGSSFLFTKLNLPRPIKIFISLDGHEIKSISQHLQAKTIRTDKSDIELTSSAIRFQDLVLSIYMNSTKWSLRCFAAFLGNWFKYLSSNIIGAEIWEKEIYTFVDEFIHKFGKYRPTDEYDKSIATYLTDALNTNSKNALSQFLSLRKQYKDSAVAPDNSLKNALILHKYLIDEPSLDIKGNELYFDLTDGDKTEKFRNFVKTYFQSNTITHYLSYRWDPHLSAGEYAQYFLYSRLFQLKTLDDESAIKCLGHVRLLKSYILFFDEIEVTIHPDLQRQLVSNVIAFLESTFGRSKYYQYRFHNIFASHSPILLSDIPRSNVVFLKCQKEGSKTTAKAISESELATKCTFGANIHSLYRDSFFLEDTLIGSFAKSRIDFIIATIDKEEFQPSDTLLSQINIIDEEVIRSFLLTKYYNRISSVKNPTDELFILQQRIAQLQ